MHRLLTLFATTTCLMSASAGVDPLDHLPSNAKTFIYYPHPAASLKTLRALATEMSDKNLGKSFAGGELTQRFGMDFDLVEGGVLVATFGDNPQAREQLVIAAPAQPKAVLAKLKAQKTGDIWTYRKAQGTKSEVRYAALKDGLLLLSTHRERLVATVACEDATSLKAWAGQADMIAGMPRQALAQGLAQARMGLAMLQSMPDEPKAKEGDQMAQLAALKPILNMATPLVTKLESSADHAAVALTLGATGMRFKGQVFFKPGSPMASEAPTAPSSPLAGLRGTDAVFAFGCSGSAMGLVNAWSASLVEAMTQGKADPEALKRWKEAQLAVAASMQSFATSFNLPSKAGAPLLSGSVSVFRVKDAKAFIQHSRTSAETQAEVVKAIPGEQAMLQARIKPVITPDVLPGVPSMTLAMDLSPLMGEGQLPPQAGMAFAMLFGGTQMKFTYGALDDQSVLMVVGDATALKDALAQARTAPALEQQPAVKAAVAQLSPGSFAQVCISPKALADAMKSFATLMGAPKAPEYGPLTGAQVAAGLYWNGAGLSFEAAGSTDALKDFAAFGKAMEAMNPKPQAPKKAGRKS